MCAHHQRMARVMALAPKKPPSVDRAPSTTFGLPPAPHANPLFQTTTSVVHVRPSAVGQTAVPLPIHVPTESFSDYLKVSFPGEVKAASLPCSFDVSSREGVSGTLVVTNYRLRFEPASTHRSATFSPALLEAITPGLPTACVSKLAYPQTTSSSNAMPTQIVVFFRNCRTWILRGNVTELMTTLNKLVFVESPLHLFAFAKGNVVDGDHANGAPKRGLFHAQNADDDYMLWLIAQTNKINSEKVWIVDCRPELNARANNVQPCRAGVPNRGAHLTLHLSQEWIKAGHKFDDRVGPGKVESTFMLDVTLSSVVSIDSGTLSLCLDDDQAPIFIQFLDCVWQLHRQYPTYFEFTGLALLALAFHATSGRFGTFLGNCDRDRAVSLRVPVRTPSLWAFMLDHAAQFRNPFFRPYDAHDHGGGALVPWPVAIVLRRVVLWDDMYFANPSCGNTSKPPAMAAASFRQAKTAAEDLEMAMASAQHQAAAHLS
ncbi:hypothetical protein DYB32_006798 [Aphanomyces invadans]|uniref:Myotubularin phosphatase domain-containing protein n=1 Tax=Aphanomyces invadans TaxID=157072 RepID=A0A418AQM2_9STRA|nr:hypothetical protein DYB32_006798 [Aphanomyces invadans]